MRTTLVIAAFGAAGAASRHLLESFVNRHWGDTFPWGTFAVNVSGSFVLGALVGIFGHRLHVQPWLRAGAVVGFLGAYTTFSTLSLQVYRSTSTGHLAVALANAFGSLAAGVLAVYAGILLTRAL
ncbi:MAG TPA: CrcB family protein [Gaiellaceae bacterium]|jgi:CrcB protein